MGDSVSGVRVWGVVVAVGANGDAAGDEIICGGGDEIGGKDGADRGGAVGGVGGGIGAMSGGNEKLNMGSC